MRSFMSPVEAPVAVSDVRLELRRRTASRHAVVDRSLSLSAGSTLEDYVDFVARLRAWWLPLQDAFWPALGAPWLARMDADLAEAAEGGVEPAAEVFAPAPRPALAGLAVHPGYAWGVRYVMEGSQLGSAVLYRRLTPALAPHALRYLRGDAEGPGPRWQRFVHELEAEVCTPAARDAAVTGACHAFDRLITIGPRVDGPANANATVNDTQSWEARA